MVRHSGGYIDGEQQALLNTLQLLARNATSLLGTPYFAIAMLDQQTGDLVNRVAVGFPARMGQGTRFHSTDTIQGWAGRTLQPILVNANQHGQHFAESFPPGAVTLACIPLLNNGQLLGAMTIASAAEDAFSGPRLNLLEIFAEQAVLAISKTLQVEESQMQARALSTLLDASRALTSSLDPDQVAHYIIASIRKSVACEDAIIYTLDAHQRRLRVSAGMGERIERIGEASISLDDSSSLAAWVAHNRRARLTAPGGTEFGEVTQQFAAVGTLSLLCVPLISRDVVRGVIMLGRERPFTSDDLGMMLNLSSIIAAALENAALYQTAWAEREQQAAIFASASDGIAIVASDLHIVEANDAFAELVGAQREYLLGQRICEALQQPALGVCQLCRGTCLTERALQSGDVQAHVESEFALQGHISHHASRLNGQQPPVRYTDFSITPMTNIEGNRVLLVGRDVTAAREMDQMKANFLSMVSHELRGPLQTINGHLDVLLSGMCGPLAQQQSDFARRARAGSEHLTSLVDDLLLISRRDAGQFNLNRQQTDLLQVLTETVEQLELLAEDAGVRLKMDAPQTLGLVPIDGIRMAQVLRNLITNAVKFTPQDGEVRVTVRDLKDAIEITVRDSGVGIAREHIDRIFERFYQVGVPTTRGRFQGQGLGLAIVRIIVEGHGGTISVSSVPQQGSTFTVRLPRQLAASHKAG